MSIVKVIEINSASKKGFEDAIQSGLAKTGKTVKNIQGAWVNETKVVTKPNGAVSEWRVSMKVSFIVD